MRASTSGFGSGHRNPGAGPRQFRGEPPSLPVRVDEGWSSQEQWLASDLSRRPCTSQSRFSPLFGWVPTSISTQYRRDCRAQLSSGSLSVMRGVGPSPCSWVRNPISVSRPGSVGHLPCLRGPNLPPFYFQRSGKPALGHETAGARSKNSKRVSYQAPQTFSRYHGRAQTARHRSPVAYCVFGGLSTSRPVGERPKRGKHKP